VLNVIEARRDPAGDQSVIERIVSEEPARPRLNVVPMPQRGPVELPAVEPPTQGAAKITQTPPPEALPLFEIPRASHNLADVHSLLEETDFAVPSPGEQPEHAPAPIQSPRAWVPAYEHADEPVEHEFVPFDFQPPERAVAVPRPKPPSTPPPRAVAQPRVAGDPLAPLMALTEEEKIALFT
jgi:hypothetical protein